MAIHGANGLGSSVDGNLKVTVRDSSKERPHDAMFIALANPVNVLALVEALESEKRICATWRKTAKSTGEKLEKAQQRIDSQREYYEGVIADGGKRIAELESRTVKMPEPFKLAKSSSGLTYYFADDVDAALTDAGIKVEAE